MVSLSFFLRLSHRGHISRTMPFLGMLPMAVAVSSSGSVRIRYVLPSYFVHNGPHGGMSIQ